MLKKVKNNFRPKSVEKNNEQKKVFDLNKNDIFNRKSLQYKKNRPDSNIFIAHVPNDAFVFFNIFIDHLKKYFKWTQIIIIFTLFISFQDFIQFKTRWSNI